MNQIANHFEIWDKKNLDRWRGLSYRIRIVDIQKKTQTVENKNFRFFWFRLDFFMLCIVLLYGKVKNFQWRTNIEVTILTNRKRRKKEEDQRRQMFPQWGNLTQTKTNVPSLRQFNTNEDIWRKTWKVLTWQWNPWTLRITSPSEWMPLEKNLLIYS